MVFCLRDEILLLADEAHRGQYGLTEKVKMMKNENGEFVAKKVIPKRHYY